MFEYTSLVRLRTVGKTGAWERRVVISRAADSASSPLYSTRQILLLRHVCMDIVNPVFYWLGLVVGFSYKSSLM